MKDGATPNSGIDAHTVFGADLCSEIAKIEEESFWFKARAELITWGLKAFFPKARRFLDVGCGPGFVLMRIEKSFPLLSIYGYDHNTNALNLAAHRLKRGRVVEFDVRMMNSESKFDVIGAFDVMEHIQEDSLLLSRMYKAVRNGGGIILTVPQHQFLWSSFDEFSNHLRRYKFAKLRKKVEKAGFRVKRMTSFVSFLLPVMACSRLIWWKICNKRNPLAELKVSRRLNRIMEKIMKFELSLIRMGFTFPVGGSIFLIAMKE